SIFIEKGLFDNLGEKIKELYSREKIAIITDKNVNEIYGDRLKRSLKGSGFEPYFIVVEPGEKSKSLNKLKYIYEELLKINISRWDLILTLGGGVVGDLGGFAAATYLRGVDYIQIPTSLLAQIDSSVGGKVAVDLDEGKNLIGNFYQPKAVFIDPLVLNTLKDRVFNDGMGELIKYALIKDKDMFEKLSSIDLENFKNSIDEYIYVCCSIKKNIVLIDEKDKGDRMLLNFGHTIGHALEKEMGFEKLTHGEGVAVGMYQITKNSEKYLITKNGVSKKIKDILIKFGLPYQVNEIRKSDIIADIEHDKKGQGEFINLILLKDIGESFIYKAGKKELENLV
ncbi:MAG: 3-dehydroquinate synthase, partial [Clostridiaceae bacterium]